MFDDFWKAYPRRVKKGAARRAYEKALKIATHEEIMEGLERFIEAEPWHGELKFCPHPSSWLNAEQWSDEYEEDAPRDPWDRAKREEEIKNRIHRKLRVVE